MRSTAALQSNQNEKEVSQKCIFMRSTVAKPCLPAFLLHVEYFSPLYWAIASHPRHTPPSHPHASAAMPPSDFHKARDASKYLYAEVDGRPYFPTLHAKPPADDDNHLSIIQAGVAVVLASANGDASSPPSALSAVSMPSDEELAGHLTVKVVSGGITNSLYRVSGLTTSGMLADALPDTSELKGHDSVLVRVFGAEGMIDRDVENSTLASLVDQGIADRYLGRFANGRLEGWLDGFRPLSKEEFADGATSDAIAVQMANLHASFVVPDYLQSFHDPSKPAMWTQLHAWMKQALSYEQFKTEADTDRAQKLNLSNIQAELDHLEKEVVPADAGVAFCHNDLLAANIMKCPTTGRIQLIDFEYGGVNYKSFDIANHFNEFAGGTTEEENGVADYALFPTEERQEAFVRAYVRASAGSNESKGDDEDKQVKSLLREVHAFVLANHLYWGLWAVNQAAMEGCDDFDYLTYAACRFDEYKKEKAKVEAELES